MTIEKNALLDESDYIALQNVMGEKFKPLLQKYCHNAQALTDTIIQALQQKDADKLKQAAHPLKSSSAQVGAAALSGIAENLEELALQDNITAAFELLQPLQDIYHQTVALLKDRITETP